MTPETCFIILVGLGLIYVALLGRDLRRERHISICPHRYRDCCGDPSCCPCPPGQTHDQ
jgi:hypothetical protein